MEAKVNSLVPVCVWHDGCPDGALAAWIVQQAMPTVDLYPGKYNVPPDLKRLRGRDVVIVDFSWKAEAMADVIRVAASVTWLDHHLSAVGEYRKMREATAGCSSIALADGTLVWVDSEDVERLSAFSWGLAAEGAAQAYVGGGRAAPEFVRMHRYLLDAQPGEIIDHKNRDVLDNRKSNLRRSSKELNGANMRRGSGLKGVTRVKTRWKAQISSGGVNRALGYYDTAEAAARAYDAAAIAQWGEHAATNFGPQPAPSPATIPKLATVLDMERSGAGITWDHFNPGQPRPQIVDVAEDRDLFRFKFPETKALHAWMSSYPLAIENRGWLAAQIENWPNAARETGDAILRYHDELVAQAAEHYRLVWVGPHIVPSVTCPCVSLVSDLGHRLLQKVPTAPFAAVLMPKSDGSTYVSLRSEDARQDVSAVAATFGGGGHRNAAGCTLKAGQSFSAAP